MIELQHEFVRPRHSPFAEAAGSLAEETGDEVVYRWSEERDILRPHCG